MLVFRRRGKGRDWVMGIRDWGIKRGVRLETKKETETGISDRMSNDEQGILQRRINDEC